jgi:hypothetical protein
MVGMLLLLEGLFSHLFTVLELFFPFFHIPVGLVDLELRPTVFIMAFLRSILSLLVFPFLNPELFNPVLLHLSEKLLKLHLFLMFSHSFHLSGNLLLPLEVDLPLLFS